MDNSPHSSFSGRYFSHLKVKSTSSQATKNFPTKQKIDSSQNINHGLKRIGDCIVISSDSETESSSRNKHLPSKNIYSSHKEVNKGPSQLNKNKTMKRKAESAYHSFETLEEKRLKADSSCDNARFTIDEIQDLFESDQLSQQIRRYFTENRQQEWFLEKKIELTTALESILNQSSIIDCQVYIVGSSINGFGRFNSDCDMCLVVDKHSTKLNNGVVMRVLSEVRRLLRHASFVRNLQLIPAKVRILKFLDCKSNMECDLNVNNLTGLRNTQLMYAYSQRDPRVKPLVLCIKEWAHQNEINDASQGTLSSYALVLMVIHFLQCGVKPFVLSSLQMKYGNQFSDNVPIDSIEDRARSIPFVRSRNRQSLSELLVGFFRYYATFDFNKVISIRRAECFSVNNVPSAGPWYRKSIRIEEPFDLSNVARAVQPDKFTRIKRCLQLAKINLHPNGKLRDLMHVTKRERHSLLNWNRPNIFGQ